MVNPTLDERIAALEKRIADEKSWKTRFEESEKTHKGQLDAVIRTAAREVETFKNENIRLTSENETFAKLKDALREIVGSPISVPVDSIGEINVNHTPLTLNIQHKSEREITYTTDDVNGRILYVLTKESPPEGATIKEIIAAFLEHAWNTSQVVAASKASNLVKEGVLIKTATGYRLPAKLKINEAKP